LVISVHSDPDSEREGHRRAGYIEVDGLNVMPRTRLESRFHVEYLILDSEGNVDAVLEPVPSGAELWRLYHAMVGDRRLDERMVRLQRQGRIGTFASIKGQEASQLGSVACLRPTDCAVEHSSKGTVDHHAPWSPRSGRLPGRRPP
jgi:hypothetical protein